MTEEKIDFFDFRRKLGDSGFDDDDVAKVVKEEKRKIHLLTFTLDNTKSKVVSYVNNMITFPSPRFPGKVEVNDVWVCSVEMVGSTYHAMPLYKVTPTFLMNLDSDLRDDVINTLWRRHKDIFLNDFAEKYKDEIHNLAIDEARKELDSIINEQKGRIAYLENQVEQDRILIKSQSVVQIVSEDTIELGSEVEPQCVELGSDVPSAAPEIPVPKRSSVSRIPNFYRTSAPGIPQIRNPDLKDDYQHLVYNVERKGEETIHSESFTEHKYFVHMSPDGKILIIRPNEFGSALCINGSIRLKGLGKVSPFTEPKRLNAEYNERYEGLMVYL